MITRIERDLYFAAGVHFQDAYYINTYDVALSMLIETDVPKEHTIALDRMDFFIKSIINKVFRDFCFWNFKLKPIMQRIVKTNSVHKIIK